MNHLPIAITAGLEQVINQVIQLDAEFPEQLSKLHDKVIAIHVSDVDVCVFLFVCSDNTIQMMSRYDGEVDATISGSSFALSRMGLSETPNELVLRGEVVLEGDVQLAKKAREVIASFNIDWEEHLSNLTGDIVAHQIGNLFKQGISWGRQTMQTLAKDMSEYIVYEKSYVPTQHELSDFLAQVDTFRADVDRLEAKIQLFEQQQEK
ncbi:MAG: SCP2 domain-containing protein [Thiohalomonadales bacterium]